MDIKALKDKILQLAIQGKLVPQNENDEPASVLLKRIKEEKEKLIKDKVIKKEKKLPDIIDDEKSFDLPNGWELAYMQDITSCITCGVASTPKYVEKGRLFLSAKNVKPYKLIMDEHKYVSEEDYEKYTKQNKPEINDILLTRVGAGIGEATVIDKNLDFAIYVSLTLIKPIHKYINSKYLLHWINSPQGVSKSIGDTLGSGFSQGNLNVNQVRQFIIPIPPIEEQKRIVDKVDSLFKLIDELYKNKQDLLQNISDSRNKILQLAIQGKLASQDENDEPASVLLEKIKEEKEHLIKNKVIRKEAPLLEISEDERLFDLPKNWSFIRLGEFIRFIGGNQPPKSTFKYEPEEGYIRLIQIRDYKSDSHITYIPYEKAKRFCSKDDIMIGRYGPPIFQILRGIEGAYNVALMKAEPIAGITKDYLYYLLKDPKLLKGLERLASRTCGQDGIDMDYLKSYVVGLPPIEEQKRIVKKLDMLMNYFDELELKMK